MKRILSLLALSLLANYCMAQAHSFTALQAAVESGTIYYGGLNEALSKYNTSSGSELGKLNVAVGYNGAISRIWDDNGIYAGVRYKRLEAKTSDKSNSDELEVLARVGAVSFESGFSLIQNSHMEIQIGFGADWRLETVEVDRNGEITKAMSEYNGSISPHFQGYLFLSRKIPLAAFGRVCYEWAFMRTDYSRVYNSLNESNLSTTQDDMNSRANTFSFSIGLAIVLHERDHSFTRGSE